MKHRPNTTAWIRVNVRLELAPRLHRCDVIAAIEQMTQQGEQGGDSPFAPWTIDALATSMAQREYRVRAAVGWLVHQGRAVNVGQMAQVNRLTGRRYTVSVYELLDEKKPTDWVGISRAFR